MFKETNKVKKTSLFLAIVFAASLCILSGCAEQPPQSKETKSANTAEVQKYSYPSLLTNIFEIPILSAAHTGKGEIPSTIDETNLVIGKTPLKDFVSKIGLEHYAMEICYNNLDDAGIAPEERKSANKSFSTSEQYKELAQVNNQHYVAFRDVSPAEMENITLPANDIAFVTHLSIPDTNSNGHYIALYVANFSNTPLPISDCTVTYVLDELLDKRQYQEDREGFADNETPAIIDINGISLGQPYDASIHSMYGVPTTESYIEGGEFAEYAKSDGFHAVIRYDENRCCTVGAGYLDPKTHRVGSAYIDMTTLLKKYSASIPSQMYDSTVTLQPEISIGIENERIRLGEGFESADLTALSQRLANANENTHLEDISSNSPDAKLISNSSSKVSEYQLYNLSGSDGYALIFSNSSQNDAKYVLNSFELSYSRSSNELLATIFVGDLPVTDEISLFSTLGKPSLRVGRTYFYEEKNASANTYKGIAFEFDDDGNLNHALGFSYAMSPDEIEKLEARISYETVENEYSLYGEYREMKCGAGSFYARTLLRLPENL